jgi:hypothetical protein
MVMQCACWYEAHAGWWCQNGDCPAVQSRGLKCPECDAQLAGHQGGIPQTLDLKRHQVGVGAGGEFWHQTPPCEKGIQWPTWPCQLSS